MTHTCAAPRSHRIRPPYASPSPRPHLKPTDAEIAKLAYSYWEARGRKHGSALEDWLRAERELHARR